MLFQPLHDWLYTLAHASDGTPMRLSSYHFFAHFRWKANEWMGLLLQGAGEAMGIS